MEKNRTQKEKEGRQKCPFSVHISKMTFDAMCRSKDEIKVLELLISSNPEKREEGIKMAWKRRADLKCNRFISEDESRLYSLYDDIIMLDNFSKLSQQEQLAGISVSDNIHFCLLITNSSGFSEKVRKAAEKRLNKIEI